MDITRIFEMIPNFTREVFRKLSLKDLARAVRVSSKWKYLIQINIFGNDPDFQDQLDEEVLIQSWVQDRERTHDILTLDCELEMRPEDLHEIRKIFTVGNELIQLVCVYVIMAQKYQEGLKDHFLFCFDSSGGQHLENVKLKRCASRFDSSTKYIIVYYGYVECGNNAFDLIDKESLEIVQELEGHPHVDEFIDILADGGSDIFLFAREKHESEDFIVCFSKPDSGDDFEEKFVIESDLWTRGMCPRIEMSSIGKYFVFWNQCHTLEVFYPSHGDIVWRNRENFFNNIKCVLNSHYLAMLMSPTSEYDNNNIVKVFDSENGSTVWIYEVPQFSTFCPVQFHFSEDHFVLVYHEPVIGYPQQVVEVMDLKTRVNRPIEVCDSVNVITSVNLCSKRLIAMTLSLPSATSQNIGQLVLADIMSEKWTEDNLNKIEDLITLPIHGKAITPICNTDVFGLVCQVKSLKAKEKSVHILFKKK